MFQALIEFLILPYASAEGRSLLDRLSSELAADKWDSFWGAVAFANESGNDKRLLAALTNFVKRGGAVSFTFGADVFGSDSYGTELSAVRRLLTILETHKKAKLFLYHERGRTFHPKIYLFSGKDEALVIMGSSNWTKGGLSENLEANVVVQLKLSDAKQRAAFDSIVATIEEYWTEAQ